MCSGCVWVTARLVEWVAEERPPGYVIPVVGGTTESRFWAHGIILQAMHLRDLAFGHRKFKFHVRHSSLG